MSAIEQTQESYRSHRFAAVHGCQRYDSVSPRHLWIIRMKATNRIAGVTQHPLKLQRVRKSQLSPCFRTATHLIGFLYLQSIALYHVLPITMSCTYLLKVCTSCAAASSTSLLSVSSIKAVHCSCTPWGMSVKMKCIKQLRKERATVCLFLDAVVIVHIRFISSDHLPVNKMRYQIEQRQD